MKSMPTWVNLSQGGSTLHSPEATKKKAWTISAGVRGKDPQHVVSGRRAKNLAEILSSYKKTKKPKKRPRAKPAAKEPPKKKAKLLPGESSEREEFEETAEDDEEEPPSGDEEEEPPAGDDDDKVETQETQIPDRGALSWACLPLQQEDQWGAWRGVPILKWRPWRTEIPRDILQQKTKLGRAGTTFWVPAEYNSAMWHSVGEYCVAARSYATEEECKNAAAVASATGLRCQLPTLLDTMALRACWGWSGGKVVGPSGMAVSLGSMELTASTSQCRASGRGVILNR